MILLLYLPCFLTYIEISFCVRQVKKHRFIVVPLVYTILFFGFVFLQFSGQLSFRKAIDPIEITGKIARGFDESSPYISSANVTVMGLRMFFSERNPLILYSKSRENSLVLPIKSYEMNETSLTLFFDNTITLAFAAKSDTVVDIILDIPEEFTQYSIAQIKINTSSRLSTPVTQDTPEIIEFVSSDTNYSLVLPPFSEYNRKDNLLQVSIATEQTVLRFSESTESFVRIDSLSILEQLNEIPQELYEARIESYIQTAYEGWTTTRLNGASGTWDQFTSPAIFSEKIVTAVLSEAWQRENETTPRAYNELVTRMRNIVQLHQSELSIDSMAFLGYMRDIIPRHLLAISNRIESLQQRMITQDIRIIEQFDLIDFVSVIGDAELNARLENFFQFLDPNELPPEYIIYLFEFYTLRDTYLPKTEPWLRPFKNIGELYLLPKIIRIDDAIFIETSVNEVDTELSLRAGLSFIRYGEETNDALLENLGRNLVNAVLSLRNENNTIPEFLYLGTRNAEISQFHFNPEQIYRFLRIDGPWPHYTQIIIPGVVNSWAWSVCSLLNAQYTENALRITVNAPIDQTSYIMFANIEPFESMTLFGLDWRNDPNFELYARGRYYDETLKSLMIKYNDSIETRAMILNYVEE